LVHRHQREIACLAASSRGASAQTAQGIADGMVRGQEESDGQPGDTGQNQRALSARKKR
jgi:hypothetical protein